MELVTSKLNYWTYVVLIMIGLYGMMVKRNLMKKLIGMNIFQWSIILYFISIGAKKGGTVPIILYSFHGAERVPITSYMTYVNPLPHVLMLTAIVVAVATTGIALALLILIGRRYKTLEEDEIIDRLRGR